MAKGKGEFRVGTSGWQYEHWKGVFYPENLRRGDWFAHYAAHFDAVEINNTFYHLPAAGTFRSWRRAGPKGFCYALKFSRYGSHLKKLKAPAESIGKFLERAELLGDLLGPILVQLPPHWRKDPARLEEFLAAAPGRHRWAVEFRDPSWLCEEVFEMLHDHHAALCIHDLIAEHPYEITADWVYFRFHGASCGGNYPHQALSAFGRRIRGHLADGLDVHAYFNNDVHGYAVANARTLRRCVLGD
jgi:uncharacterized protein YecE (DUF72 family)